ncbi:MAG: hypothetical protein V4613_08680 [Bacteroidota bacterium]
MKKRIILIILNVIIVVFSINPLYQEYKIKGTLVWPDPDLVEDHEETLFIPFLIAVIVLGLMAITYELLKTQKQLFIRLLNIVLRFLSYMYGFILFFSSLLVLVRLFANIGNHDHENGFVLSITLTLLILLSICSLGCYIMYNNYIERDNQQT